MTWREDAACATTDPEVFFPDIEEGWVTIGQAKKICGTCPVVSQCLAFAVEGRIDHGVWGGLTARERLNLRTAA